MRTDSINNLNYILMKNKNRRCTEYINNILFIGSYDNPLQLHSELMAKEESTDRKHLAEDCSRKCHSIPCRNLHVDVVFDIDQNS